MGTKLMDGTLYLTLSTSVPFLGENLKNQSGWVVFNETGIWKIMNAL